MKSNDDNTGSQWAAQTLEGRAFSLELEFFWQESEAIPASQQLDGTHVGSMIDFIVYPDDAPGVRYEGRAIIDSVSLTGEVNGDIACSVSLTGDGPLQVYA